MIIFLAAVVASCIDLSKGLQTSEDGGSTSQNSQTGRKMIKRKENQLKPINKAKAEKEAERRSNNNARERQVTLHE